MQTLESLKSRGEDVASGQSPSRQRNSVHEAPLGGLKKCGQDGVHAAMPDAQADSPRLLASIPAPEDHPRRKEIHGNLLYHDREHGRDDPCHPRTSSTPIAAGHGQLDKDDQPTDSWPELSEDRCDAQAHAALMALASNEARHCHRRRPGPTTPPQLLSRNGRADPGDCFVTSDSKKEHCREPARTMFKKTRGADPPTTLEDSCR